jgi:electron transport complex protein RnfG
MLRAMVGVGFASGLLIVSAFLATRPAIEQNRAEALRLAIFEVLPRARSHESFEWGEPGRFERSSSEPDAGAASQTRVHAGYDETQQLVGLAIEAAGMGYQDVIRVLYSYSFERSAIVGLRVLESRETPGLGDRIETDPGFRANFERLDVSLTDDLERLAHPIEAVKHGEKVHSWQIDGITGATISSQAIADILGRSAEAWIPRIRRRLADFDTGS